VIGMNGRTAEYRARLRSERSGSSKLYDEEYPENIALGLDRRSRNRERAWENEGEHLDPPLTASERARDRRARRASADLKAGRLPPGKHEMEARIAIAAEQANGRIGWRQSPSGIWVYLGGPRVAGFNHYQK